MECSAVRKLLSPAVDAELDVRESTEVESHLQGCAACRAQFETERALRDAVRRDATYFRGPAALESAQTFGQLENGFEDRRSTAILQDRIANRGKTQAREWCTKTAGTLCRSKSGVCYSTPRCTRFVQDGTTARAQSASSR